MHRDSLASSHLCPAPPLRLPWVKHWMRVYEVKNRHRLLGLVKFNITTCVTFLYLEDAFIQSDVQYDISKRRDEKLIYFIYLFLFGLVCS